MKPLEGSHDVLNVLCPIDCQVVALIRSAMKCSPRKRWATALRSFRKLAELRTGRRHNPDGV
ncbi:MAG: hypothetical protein ACLSA6_09825 [Holdemania massiliensis]